MVYDPWAGQRITDPATLSPQAQGDRMASNLICNRRAKNPLRKQDVVDFALRLEDGQVEGACRAFHAQGARLWGFWCAAMRARHKAGKGGVPDYMR